MLKQKEKERIASAAKRKTGKRGETEECFFVFCFFLLLLFSSSSSPSLPLFNIHGLLWDDGSWCREGDFATDGRASPASAAVCIIRVG